MVWDCAVKALSRKRVGAVLERVVGFLHNATQFHTEVGSSDQWKDCCDIRRSASVWG